jgi:Tfp pilus assembly protein PilF
VEGAGVYFETTVHDVEKESGGRSTQTSSCEICLRLNQPEQAIEDLSTVIRIDPTNAAALVTRAKLYGERLQGRLAKKDDLERACVLGSTPVCEQLP